MAQALEKDCSGSTKTVLYTHQRKQMNPKLENGKWCCPQCWAKNGLWMPWKGPTCECGYEFPEWLMEPLQAILEAKALWEKKEYSATVKVKWNKPHELILERCSDTLRYKGLKFPKKVLTDENILPS